MLIMFILVAPLMEMDNVELAHGGPHSQDVPATVETDHPLVVHVRRDNSLYCNRRKVTAQELQDIFIQMHRLHPEIKPLLLQDKQAFFGTYQDVKARAEIAGFSEMDILLNPS